MGQAIQAQCKKLTDIQVSDFQAKEFDSNGISALIDFSSPEGFNIALKFCKENKIPFISGTTGLSAKNLEAVKAAKKIIPILIASNMSLGIANLKSSIQKYLISINTSVKCKIVEIHHTKKKDSPSGTALEIVKFLENFHASKIDGSIDIKSYRIGNIFGIHRIEFKSEEGIINFQHIASSRDVFAIGALQAARSINSMEIGEYSFADFLNKKL
jgi:4-hydroxy-tetrahydrodipicolinate reductase